MLTRFAPTAVSFWVLFERLQGKWLQVSTADELLVELNSFFSSHSRPTGDDKWCDLDDRMAELRTVPVDLFELCTESTQSLDDEGPHFRESALGLEPDARGAGQLQCELRQRPRQQPPAVVRDEEPQQSHLRSPASAAAVRRQDDSARVIDIDLVDTSRPALDGLLKHTKLMRTRGQPRADAWAAIQEGVRSQMRRTPFGPDFEFNALTGVDAAAVTASTLGDGDALLSEKLVAVCTALDLLSELLLEAALNTLRTSFHEAEMQAISFFVQSLLASAMSTDTCIFRVIDLNVSGSAPLLHLQFQNHVIAGGYGDVGMLALVKPTQPRHETTACSVGDGGDAVSRNESLIAVQADPSAVQASADVVHADDPSVASTGAGVKHGKDVSAEKFLTFLAMVSELKPTINGEFSGQLAAEMMAVDGLQTPGRPFKLADIARNGAHMCSGVLTNGLSGMGLTFVGCDDPDDSDAAASKGGFPQYKFFVDVAGTVPGGLADELRSNAISGVYLLIALHLARTLKRLESFDFCESSGDGAANLQWSHDVDGAQRPSDRSGERGGDRGGKGYTEVNKKGGGEGKSGGVGTKGDVSNVRSARVAPRLTIRNQNVPRDAGGWRASSGSLRTRVKLWNSHVGSDTL